MAPLAGSATKLYLIYLMQQSNLAEFVVILLACSPDILGDSKGQISKPFRDLAQHCRSQNSA